MQITVKRVVRNKTNTIGFLEVRTKADNVPIFTCFTLEDVERDTKVMGKTAIPIGQYKILWTWSPRFNRFLPLVSGVKNFEGVRIHAGNDENDTEGCILVGLVRNVISISHSKAAAEILFDIIEKQAKKGAITLFLE